VMFLRGVQLVLRPRVLTVLDFNEVDVTLKLAKILILMPSEIGGLVGSWW